MVMIIFKIGNRIDMENLRSGNNGSGNNVFWKCEV